MKKFYFRLDSVLLYENYRKSIIENDLVKYGDLYRRKKVEENLLQKDLEVKIESYYKGSKDLSGVNLQFFLNLKHITEFKRNQKEKNKVFFHDLDTKLQDLKSKWMVFYKRIYSIKNYRNYAYKKYVGEMEKEEDQNLSEMYLNQKYIQKRIE